MKTTVKAIVAARHRRLRINRVALVLDLVPQLQPSREALVPQLPQLVVACLVPQLLQLVAACLVPQLLQPVEALAVALEGLQLPQRVVACLVPLLLQPVEALALALVPQLPQLVAACLGPLLQSREALVPLHQRAEDYLVPQLLPREALAPLLQRAEDCLVPQPPHPMVHLPREALVLLHKEALELPLQPQEDSLDRPVLHQLLVVMELRLLVVCLVLVLLQHHMVHPLVDLVLLPQLPLVHHSPGAMEDSEVHHLPRHMEDMVLLRRNSSISSRDLLNSTEPPPCRSM
jgi:hypothetical protein